VLPYGHCVLGMTVLRFCNGYVKCLPSILGLRWWHKVPHTEIRRRANTECIEYWLATRQLRWIGRVIRMPPYRLPRRLLYGALQRGQRSVGGQKKRFSITSKTHLRSAAYHLIDWKLSLQTERVGVIRLNCLPRQPHC